MGRRQSSIQVGCKTRTRCRYPSKVNKCGECCYSMLTARMLDGGHIVSTFGPHPVSANIVFLLGPHKLDDLNSWHGASNIPVNVVAVELELVARRSRPFSMLTLACWFPNRKLDIGMCHPGGNPCCSRQWLIGYNIGTRSSLLYCFWFARLVSCKRWTRLSCWCSTTITWPVQLLQYGLLVQSSYRTNISWAVIVQCAHWISVL